MVVEHAKDDGFAAMAKLGWPPFCWKPSPTMRHSRQLQTMPDAFAGLAADRRGDIYNQPGKGCGSESWYLKAYKSTDEQALYRRILVVKLNAMGLDPEADAKTSKSGVAS